MEVSGDGRSRFPFCQIDLRKRIFNNSARGPLRIWEVYYEKCVCVRLNAGIFQSRRRSFLYMVALVKFNMTICATSYQPLCIFSYRGATCLKNSICATLLRKSLVSPCRNPTSDDPSHRRSAKRTPPPQYGSTVFQSMRSCYIKHLRD